MSLCLSVCLSVCQKAYFIEMAERIALVLLAWRLILHCVIREFGYFQHKDTFVWKFNPNSGLTKNFSTAHRLSQDCCQLSSTDDYHTERPPLCTTHGREVIGTLVIRCGLTFRPYTQFPNKTASSWRSNSAIHLDNSDRFLDFAFAK